MSTTKSNDQFERSGSEKEQYDLVARLLRMKEACEGWKKTELLKHLEDKYHLEIKSLDQLGKIMRQDKGSGFYHNPENATKWRNFVAVERESIISKMSIPGQFSRVETSFNFESAFDLMDAAGDAERCIFWNTYIDLNEWHSPIIQMHLCIQKSIEQKNNFSLIHDCHNLAGKVSERKVAISFCTKNPPVYRHYRILFLPITDKEFSDRLSLKDSFYENLRFSTLMHCSLSIQLAVITVTQLANIFIREHSDFFKLEKNLTALGLDSSLSSMLTNKRNISEIEKILKEKLEALGNIPDNATEIGMDFLHIQRAIDKKGQKNFWTAYDDKNEGLTYYPFKDDENIKIKKKFSEIVFEAITETLPPVRLDIMKLDPIYPFYEKDKTRVFSSIVGKYNPKNKVELYS